MQIILNYLFLFIMVLISVSFFTLFERKLLSYFQNRKGPNKVGMIGILQAFSDGMKLFSNEFFILFQIDELMYFFAPIMMFLISYFMWIFFPFFFSILNFENYMLILFCLLSLNVYPLMFAGIYSMSIYAMLGGIRSITQTISYEVCFIMIILSFLVLIESLNYIDFSYLNWDLILIIYPISLILYVSILAELNRTPFDFSEGESELISGYNIEYSSCGFTLIFLSEYSNIIFLNLIFVILVLNSYMNLNFIIWMFMMYMIILFRGLLPRLRYDKLMYLVWLIFLPLSINYLMYFLILKYLIF